MHCPMAWGQWALQLLQYTASLPLDSGHCNFCSALPHRLGAVGSGTPAIQCPTTWGLWAVQLLQYAATLQGHIGHCNSCIRTATLLRGGAQWNSCNALPECSEAVGRSTGLMHRLTTCGQWAVELHFCTATMSWGSRLWNSCNALPHCLGAMGNGTRVMHCLGAGNG